jgi:hypothetical protein
MRCEERVTIEASHLQDGFQGLGGPGLQRFGFRGAPVQEPRRMRVGKTGEELAWNEAGRQKKTETEIVTSQLMCNHQEEKQTGDRTNKRRK